MEIRIKTTEEFRADHVTIEIRADRDEAVQVAELLDDRSDHALYGAALDAERELVQARREIEELRRQRDTTQQAKDFAVSQLDKVRGRRDIERDRADRVTREHSACEGRVKLREADAETWRSQRNALEKELARYRRAHVCTVECTENAHTAFQGRTLITELEQELAAEREVISRLEADLRRAREEIERRFTAVEVADAKAGAREDARAAMQREVVKPLDEKLAEAEQSLQVLADLLGKVNGLMLGSEIRQALDGFSIAPVGYDILATAVRKVRDLLGVSWDKAPREV